MKKVILYIAMALLLFGCKPVASPIEPLPEIIPYQLPGNSINAEFQKPDSKNFSIANTAYDQERDTYAILYATSNYPEEQYPLMTYSADNAQLEIQLFNGQGKFLEHMATEIAPCTNPQTGIVSSEPCLFKDGILTFYSGLYEEVNNLYYGEYIFFDTITKTYTSTPAMECAADDGYLIMRNYNVFSLYYLNKKQGEIAVDIDDRNLFKENLAIDDRGDYRGYFLELDGNSKIARAGDYKITCILDFNDLTWNTTRRYDKSLLEHKLGTSPDGRREIYSADGASGGGESWWEDIVSLDTQTGEITYLMTGGCWGGTYDGIAIFNDSMLLINQFFHLVLIDMLTSEIINENFAIDCNARDCVVQAITYDPERDWYIFAWTSNQESDRGTDIPIMLDIYDSQGHLIKTCDTGVLTYRSNNSLIVPLILTLDNEEVVTFNNTQDDLGIYKYDTD